jgi:hypothetical protein
MRFIYEMEQKHPLPFEHNAREPAALLGESWLYCCKPIAKPQITALFKKRKS